MPRLVEASPTRVASYLGPPTELTDGDGAFAAVAAQKASRRSRSVHVSVTPLIALRTHHRRSAGQDALLDAESQRASLLARLLQRSHARQNEAGS